MSTQFNPVSLSLIESKMIDMLKEATVVDGDGSLVVEFDARKGLETINRFPAICVATEAVGFRDLDGETLEWSPRIVLYMVFKNVSNEGARRKGAYPILEGSVRLLSFQTFDLEIDPLLPVGEAQEVVHQSLESRGLIGFKVPFSTSFDVSKYEKPRDIVKLIMSGVKYYLQPDDGVHDYSDEIQLQDPDEDPEGDPDNE